jgi:hypothetical protein
MSFLYSPGARLVAVAFAAGPLAYSALASIMIVAASTGCAPTVRGGETGSAGGDSPIVASGSGGGATTGGMGGEGGEGGAGGAGGAGGMIPPVCMPSQRLYGGPLCGPPELPCNLLADELVHDTYAGRNEAPGVALDENDIPHFIFSVAQSGYQGFYARREAPNTFLVEQTPFSVARGGIAVDDLGTVYILADGADDGVGMFTRSQGQWSNAQVLEGQLLASASGLAKDEKGHLHVGMSAGQSIALYSRYDMALQSWLGIEQLGSQGEYRVPIAVTPAGDAHMAYWLAQNETWVLHWQTSKQPSEPVVSLPSGTGLSGPSEMHRIALTPDDANGCGGVPHLLVVRSIADAPNGNEIVHAVRKSPGGWDIVPIDQEDIAAVQSCGPPMATGDTCTYEYEEIIPIGIVASQNGQVRVIYNKVHHLGTFVAECQQIDCLWTNQSDSSIGQLIVSGVGPGAVKSVVSNAIAVEGATVALDTIGRIHIAAYDYEPPASFGTRVRYLLIGP